jgi:hypothetical protein
MVKIRRKGTGGGGSSISFGNDNEIPFTNSAGDDFDYSSGFTYNGNGQLTIDGGGLVNSAIHLNGSVNSTIRSTATDLLEIVHNGNTPIRISESGDISLPNDNQKLYFGADDDASIYYDGTDLQINPREVGSGGLGVGAAPDLGAMFHVTDGNGYARTSTAGGGGWFVRRDTTSAGQGVFTTRNANNTNLFAVRGNGAVTVGSSSASVGSPPAGDIIADGDLCLGYYRSQDGYSIYNETGTYWQRMLWSDNGTTNDAVYQFQQRDGSGDYDDLFVIDDDGSLHTPLDNAKHYFGTGDDAAIYYDGTDLIIDPQVVGGGNIKVADTWTLPNTAGTDGQVLTSDGAGGAVWEDASGGRLTNTMDF